MRFRFPRGFAAICAGLLCLITAAAHAQNTPDAVKAACNPGKDPQEPGSDYPGGISQTFGALTPVHLPGATTISVREAKCMMDHFPDYVVVVAAVDDERRIPGSNEAAWTANPAPDIQAEFAKVFANALKGDKTRPLIFYCHNIRCFMSYNAALRAVNAGYTSVYWMREGLLGWEKAGYAFLPIPPRPGEKTLSQRFVGEIARCRKDYATYTGQEWAGMLSQIPTEEEQEKEYRRLIADDLHMFQICMGNLRRDAVGGAADIAEADRIIAGAPAEVEAAYAAARAEAEGNPAKYLAMTWDSHKPAALRADLAIMRNGKSLEQSCGALDLSQPPVGPGYNDYIHNRNAQRITWGECAAKYRSDLTTVGKTFGLESANKWIKATRRFTCSRNRKPNCIPDAPFNEVAEIATDANVDYVNRRDKFFSDERSKVNDLVDRANAWIDEVNRRIGEYNASH